MTGMPRKRRESTFYLGEELQRSLDEYRRSYPVPPSASALVREAVRRFLEDGKAHEGTLPPRAWVEATEPLVRWQAEQGVNVSTEDILRALEEAEAERTRRSRSREGFSFFTLDERFIRNAAPKGYPVRHPVLETV